MSSNVNPIFVHLVYFSTGSKPLPPPTSRPQPPASTPRSAPPAPTPRSTPPAPAPRSAAPAPTPRSLPPAPTPRSSHPAPTPNLNVPETPLRGSSSTPFWKRDKTKQTNKPTSNQTSTPIVPKTPQKPIPVHAHKMTATSRPGTSPLVPKTDPNKVNTEAEPRQVPDRVLFTAPEHDLDARYKYLIVYNIPRTANRATIELKFQVPRKNVRFLDDSTAIVRCTSTESADRALGEQESSNAVEYRVKEAPMSLIEQMYDEQMRTVFVRFVDSEKKIQPVPMHYIKRFMLKNFGSGYYKVMDGRAYYTFDTYESLALFKNAVMGRQYIKFRVMENGAFEDLLCCHFEDMPPAARFTVEFIPMNMRPMSPESAIHDVRTALHKKAIDPSNDILKD